MGFYRIYRSLIIVGLLLSSVVIAAQEDSDIEMSVIINNKDGENLTIYIEASGELWLHDLNFATSLARNNPIYLRDFSRFEDTLQHPPVSTPFCFFIGNDLGKMPDTCRGNIPKLTDDLDTDKNIWNVDGEAKPLYFFNGDVLLSNWPCTEDSTCDLPISLVPPTPTRGAVTPEFTNPTEIPTSSALDSVPTGMTRIPNTDIAIDTTEITVSEYQAFIDSGGYSNHEYWSDEGWHWLNENSPVAPAVDDGYYPRTRVSWYEAEAFCDFHGKQSGLFGRLPFENEWEQAARGTNDTRIYPWGNSTPDRDELLNFDNPVGGLMRVQSGYPANEIGLYDMAGNASEWVADLEGDSRIAKGGSFYSNDDDDVLIEASETLNPDHQHYVNVGFRCVVELRD